MIKKAKVLSAFLGAFGKTIVSGGGPGIRWRPVREQLKRLSAGHMRFWARNLHLYLEEDLQLVIHSVEADLAVHDPEVPIIPERKDSYDFRVIAGHIAMSEETLSRILTRYVLAKGPLEDAELSLPGDRLVLQARVRKGAFRVPIRLEAVPAIDARGMIALTPLRIAIGNLGVGGVMQLLRVDLASLIELPAGSPLEIRGNTVLLDPEGIIPEPRTLGSPTEVALAPGWLHLYYHPGTEADPPPLLEGGAANYLYCIGHDLLIGKMLLGDACFQVVNKEPADHLDFSLERYRLQLSQGESSLKPGGEVLARIPNLDGLSSSLTTP